MDLFNEIQNLIQKLDLSIKNLANNLYYVLILYIINNVVGYI